MRTAFQARYVLPITSSPIEDAFVVVEDGRVVQIARGAPPGVELVDLNELNDISSGGAALLPALVNAHTHLEFSDLSSPLGEAGMAFADWIRAVIQHRQGSNAERSHAQRERTTAVIDGLRQSVAGGATTIGEIATADWPWEILTGNADDRPLRPRVTLFHEMLGLAEDRADRAAAELESFRVRMANSPKRWRAGVSPHAPYSTHWKLIETLCDRSRERAAPLAMHLAESREELELLQSHGGPFRELLDDLGVWNAAGVPLGARPLDYLKLLARAHRALVIHGNYLADDEIDYVAAHAETMSVIFCPRTHAYFQHAPYPLARLLAAGANVALGTDSRASNPDLSLLAEMRFVARQFRDISSVTVLRMGTINGARALGLHEETGSLAPGKSADFAVIALPNRDAADPHELLLDCDLPNVATFIAGQRSALFS